MAITETRDVTPFVPRKAIVALLFGAVLASVAYLIYLDMHYFIDTPRNPDPIAGRVFPLTVNHGYLVYVTQEERSRFFLAENPMSIGGGLSFLIGGILAIKYRIGRKL
jgi:hypothetical protein